jgi:two-component system NtrC family response regulator/two-component system response regulator HydG
MHNKILGSSPQAQLLQKLVHQAGPLMFSVLICGERGVGREFVAGVIHEESGRSGRFVRLSCLGMNETVLAAELRERVQEATQGTLFIDEIDVTSLAAQPEWIRIAEEAGVRVIVATTVANPEDRVVSSSFGIRINVPSLRERPSDIPVMVHHFAGEFARLHGKPVRGVESPAASKLMTYSWPGNVRELRDAVERAVLRSNRPFLATEDFDFLVTATEQRPLQFRIPGATIQEIEREAILRTVEHTGGSTTAAARILQMSVRKIQYKLRQYREDAAVAAPAKSQAKSAVTS